MKLSSKTGIKPENSHLSKQLKMHNADQMKMLEASNRHDFDKHYVDAMVRDHQDALAFLDKAIKDSTNPTLTKDLQEARQHIAIHLEKAKKVQQHMG